MQTINLTLYQAQHNYHISTATFRGFVGGRGAGKSFVGAFDMLERARRSAGLYLVAAPTYKMLADSSFRSFQALAQKLPYVKKSKHLHTILRNGSEILWRSTDDPERLRGPNYSGAWLDEASQMDVAAYEIIIATLREGGKLGWLGATFTPRGRQHWTFLVFASQRPNSTIFRARTLDNPFNPPEFYETIRQQYTSSLALQELDGQFTDLSGAMFRRHWFIIEDAAPKDGVRVRFWDLAATAPRGGRDPDWTAGVLVQRAENGLYHILDVRRERTTPAGVETLVRQTAELDGYETLIYMEQEPGSSGVNTIDHYRRRVLPGYAFWGQRQTGQKAERALPFAAMAEAGNIRLLRAAWNKEFLDELEVFPLGVHDDQADAAAGAFNIIAQRAIGPWPVNSDPEARSEFFSAPAGVFRPSTMRDEDLSEEGAPIEWPW